MSIFSQIEDEHFTMERHLRRALDTITRQSDEPRSARIASLALTAKVHKCWECGDHYIESEGCVSDYCLEQAK